MALSEAWLKANNGKEREAVEVVYRDWETRLELKNIGFL